MKRRPDRDERSCRRICGALATLLTLVMSGQVSAQVVRLVGAADTEAGQKNLPGFQIPIDDSLTISFQDFERYSKRGDWEKAFRALGEIPAAKRTGMLRGPRGMIVPAERRIWESVAELPADGREAFRVFFDARARNLWKDVGQPGRRAADDLQTASGVYEEYFLTSVGDDAANFLGDAAFEQGQFSEADRYWRAVLDHHPNTDLGELRIQVKRALALLQMGRLRTFDALLNTIAQTSAGETVTLGGESVEVVSFLKSIRAAHDAASGGGDQVADATRTPMPTGPISETTEVAWRIQYLSDLGQEQLNNAVNNNYWYRNGMETLVPPYAVSGGRLVCNWFGIVFALDGQTGKLLWRNEKFDKVHSQFSQLPHSSANLDQYAVAAGQNVALANWLDPQRLNYYREPFRLIAYEMDSGKERWNSQKLAPLKDFSFVGAPLIIGDDVLVTCHKRNEAKLILKSLNLSAGSENWFVDLGTAQKSQNQRGGDIMPLPQLVKEGQTLYILTNNGALLALDLKNRELQWALKYETAAAGNSNGVIYSGDISSATLLHSYGVLLQHEGVLYAKESGGSAIHAVDPAGPRLLWSRPIAMEAVLVGVDDDQLYLLSRELMAIDRESQELVWARRLPIEGGGLSAVVGEDTVYVSSRRGIYCVSRGDGRLRTIFRGADLGAVGAWIDIVGDRLVSISNSAITAYPFSASHQTSVNSTGDDSRTSTSAAGATSGSGP